MRAGKGIRGWMRLSGVFLAILLASGVAEGKKREFPEREQAYRPHLLPTVEDAGERLRVLLPMLKLERGLNSSCLVADRTGLRVFFVTEGSDLWKTPQYAWQWRESAPDAMASMGCQYTHVFSMKYADVNSISYDTGEAGRQQNQPDLMIRVCTRGDICQSLYSAEEPRQNQVLMDALLTLVVASGNTQVVALDTPWSTIADWPRLSKKWNKELDAQGKAPKGKHVRSAGKKPHDDSAITDAGVVAMVQAESAAEMAGLRDGDLVTSVDGVAYHQNIYGEMAAKCLNAQPAGCRVHVAGMRKKIPIQFGIEVKPAFTAEEARKLQAEAAERVSPPASAPPVVRAPTPVVAPPSAPPVSSIGGADAREPRSVRASERLRAVIRRRGVHRPAAHHARKGAKAA